MTTRLSTAMTAGLLVAASAAVATAGNPVVDQANAWEMNILPQNNQYASPSTVTVSDTGTVNASAVCGGYAALLVRAAYPALTTTVLKTLTGSASPTSKQWNDAIESGASYSNVKGTFSLVERTTVGDITGGDVLASEYVSGSITGHTMIVDSLWLDGSNVATTIPGVAKADRWVVVVHDATSAPHGASDSRWRAQDGAHDQGIGSGELFVFADPLTGAIVGWTWSTTSTTTYQGTDASAPNYRPMVAGTLVVPGMTAEVASAPAAVVVEVTPSQPQAFRPITLAERGAAPLSKTAKPGTRR